MIVGCAQPFRLEKTSEIHHFPQTKYMSVCSKVMVHLFTSDLSLECAQLGTKVCLCLAHVPLRTFSPCMGLSWTEPKVIHPYSLTHNFNVVKANSTYQCHYIFHTQQTGQFVCK
ncbi:hypothetical protein CDAR_124321 [Caerostris darwini]|uniref:Uncharacterized protein n=1 Tax=Caerostris darwini TaxID=1538125 RepID=A0AAV4VRX5_9ARAC|nr:hypothetical protein CDAR_124321 [Caerostris darwini]